ncbi:MAG: glycosyltransferase [Pontiella sp.]
MKLSIIIPAHNEEHRLPPVLEAYAVLFSTKMGADVEIIVVVNGSTDNTAAVANRIAEQISIITVIDEPRRIGKGGAIILGVQKAIGDWVGFVDADGATSAEEFLRLYGVTQQSKDGVIASRWMKGADVVIPQRAMRLLSSRTFNWLTRILLGLKYKDTQCGAKIFSSKAWKSILPDIGTTRFAFDVDTLYQLKRHGYYVTEEPTIWKDIEGSKVNIFNSSLEMFLAILRMRLLHSPLRFTVHLYDRFLSRVVEFLLRDDLFRHTVLLFFASIITMFCNIGYQMVVGRALPPEEFTLLATFFALFGIASRPLGTISTALNRYTSLLVRDGKVETVRRLLIKWMIIMGGVAAVAGIVCLVFAPQISAFFHLNRIAPVVVSALALPVLIMNPVFGGVMRGLQRFVWSAASSIGMAAGRILFGALFVVLLHPACGWALAGHVAGMYLAMLICFIGLLPVFRMKNPFKDALPSLRLYLFQCFFIQICAGLLMTGDMIFVKHYLPNDADFAYAITLARMVAFMAISVATALFPKVSSEGCFTREHRKVYLRSQVYTACFVAVSLSICFVFPKLVFHFIYGIEDPGAHLIGLTRWMAVVTSLMTMLNVNINVLLSQRRFKLLSVVVICALAYVGVIHVFHNSIYNIVFAAGLANMVALCVTTIGIMVNVERKARGEKDEV